MKRTLSVLLLISLMGCNKTKQEIQIEAQDKVNLTPVEYKSIFINEGDVINIENIGKLLQDFSEQTVDPNLKTKTSKSVKIVKMEPFNVGTKSSSSINTKSLLNVLSVSENGDSTSSLISVDARLPAVLAYIKGSRAITENKAPEAVSLMLNAALKSYEDKLNVANNQRDSIKLATISKISQKTSIPKKDLSPEKIKSLISVKTEIGTKSQMLKDPRDLYTSWVVINNYIPFLRTSWGHAMPYNRLMPQTCTNNWLWDYRFPIPSSAVAIAQILAFYKPAVTMNGMTMDWTYLTVNKEIHEETDYFGTYVQDPLLRRNMVAELMKGVIANCNISYTCTGSSMTITPVKNYLATFQITTGAETGLTWPPIRNSIADFKPGLLYGQTDAGQGHFMVVDGGMLMRTTPTDYIDFHFVHVNMGMGEAYNGYYLQGDQKLEPGFATFTKNWKLLPSITKNYTN